MAWDYRRERARCYHPHCSRRPIVRDWGGWRWCWRHAWPMGWRPFAVLRMRIVEAGSVDRRGGNVPVRSGVSGPENPERRSDAPCDQCKGDRE